jgi:uncharacterized protein
MVQFDGFDWDEGNAAKCLKHGLTREEIEAALFGSPLVAPDIAHSKLEDRLIAIGTSTLRPQPIFIAFTVRHIGNRTLLRPISARPMHAKEIARYARQSPATDL